jgi:hypothetical protein
MKSPDFNKYPAYLIFFIIIFLSGWYFLCGTVLGQNLVDKIFSSDGLKPKIDHHTYPITPKILQFLQGLCSYTLLAGQFRHLVLMPKCQWQK